jgi:hypothetical protein
MVQRVRRAGAPARYTRMRGTSIECVVRRASDLQVDARERPLPAENSRNSEQTRIRILEIVRGVRRPSKSGLEERPLPRPDISGAWARQATPVSRRRNPSSNLPATCSRIGGRASSLAADRSMIASSAKATGNQCSRGKRTCTTAVTKRAPVELAEALFRRWT